MNTQPSTTASAYPLRTAGWALLLAFAVPAVAEAPAADGLIPVKARSFDKAWQKPGTDFKSYTGIVVRPATVEFSKAWRPSDYGTYGLRDKDVERIRSRIAKIADESFAKVLSQDGYRIADAAAGNVLEVQIEVVDLYINAPDIDSDVFSRNYVRSFGDLRLLVTLRDSISGTTLFRSSDLMRGDETGRLEWANAVYNHSEAQRLLGAGARQLKRFLVAQ